MVAQLAGWLAANGKGNRTNVKPPKTRPTTPRKQAGCQAALSGKIRVKLPMDLRPGES